MVVEPTQPICKICASQVKLDHFFGVGMKIENKLKPPPSLYRWSLKRLKILECDIYHHFYPFVQTVSCTIVIFGSG